MSTVELLTIEQIKARHAALLASVGDEQAFRRRAEDYQLSADELATMTELEELEWLVAQAQ
ncbi:hypothetical protein [Kineococcus terrestris]|uniref:hypothetical protein n=1 Tax=Kineococcus terrestris TaxID=2044856 RepID=UPI0034DB1D8E